MKLIKNFYNSFDLDFIKFQTIIVCLLPLLLITGPAIPDIIVTILSISYLTYILRNNNTFSLYADIKIFLYLIIFYIFIVFSSLFASDIISSLKFSLPYLRFILFSFLISFLIKNNSNKFYTLFFISCSVSISLLFVDTIFQFFNGKNILGFETIDSQNRISSFFRKMILGSYVLKILPIFLVAIFYLIRKRNFNHNLFILFYFISAVIIFLSGDRAPLLLLMIFSLGIFIVLKNYRKIFFIFLVFIFCLFLLLTMTQKRYHDRYIVRTLNEIGLGTDKEYNIKVSNFSTLEFYNKKIFLFSSIHENYFITAINIFKDNILIGAGPKSYGWLSCLQKYQLDRLSCATHPHNFYIQLLAETGIFGFGFVSLAFLYFIIYLFKLLYSVRIKHEFSKEGLIIALLGMIIHLWPITTTGSFFTNYNCIFIFFCFGFFLGEKKNNSNLLKNIL
jgi:O-antigen ligase